MNDDFIEPIYKNKLFLHAIIGNHDTYFKNTNEINSMNVLYRDNAHFNYYHGPAEFSIDGCKILFMPWLCSGNYEQCMDVIEKTDAQVLFGHLELTGFEMYKGMPNDHGFDAKLFDKFDVVCSGHFHHKSSRGNIHYLGAPYEMTWSDYNDPKYFHIFDTDTQELTPVLNPLTMFEKAFYDDTKETFETIANKDYSNLKGKFVKVVVVNKDNPYWFDTFIDKVHGQSPLHVSVVDDNKHMDFFDDDDIEDIEDTLTILSKYVDGLDIQGKKKHLNELMTTLYNEALEEHNFL